MFRKSIITITIAAAAFVTLGSSAPADAHAIDCWLEPLHCIIDVATPDRDRGPVEEDTTLDPGAVAGAAGIDIGSILFPVPAIPPLTPGGVSTDIDPGVVIVPALPDGVLDAITGPVVDLPPIETLPIDPPAAPESTEPPAEVPAVPETPEAPVAPATPAATPEADSSTDTTVAPAVVEASTSTSAAVQEEVNDDSAEALVETAAVADATSSIDPMMAGLFGVLGALALMLVVFTAFAAGRRRTE
jgi:hypothetical protein